MRGAELQEDKVVLGRRTCLPPFPLPSQLSFLLWFVVITKIYACCSTNLRSAIMSLSEQARDGLTLSDSGGKSIWGHPLTVGGRGANTWPPAERVEDALPCREDACTATFATSCLEAPRAAAPLSAVWGGAQSVPFAKGSSRRPLPVGVSCD